MALSPEYVDDVLTSLADLGEIEARRMFGGCGLYSAGLFFALCINDTLYFKVDEAGRAECRAMGLAAFEPRPGAGASPGYFALPAVVLGEPAEKRRWFERALAAARATKPSRKRGLAALRNIGPVSGRWLAAVGVESREELERRGAVQIWLAVREARGRVSVNLLYALEGARTDRHWASLSPAERESLKQRAGLLP